MRKNARSTVITYSLIPNRQNTKTSLNAEKYMEDILIPLNILFACVKYLMRSDLVDRTTLTRADDEYLMLDMMQNFETIYGLFPFFALLTQFVDILRSENIRLVVDCMIPDALFILFLLFLILLY